MHEVVTLQFGQQANYLGTHYWNTQESYFTYDGQEESPVDHDVSFRPGIGADGTDTYTPRTLIYDLKGAFGTLRRENALYQLDHQENSPQNGLWSGSTIPLQLPPIAPSSYQQALDQGTSPPQLTTDTVRYWSDYNHIFYHPRSIVQLNDYELNSSLMPFERWQTGEELFANLDREHDLLDRDLRPFLEECDQLQGLQVFAGIDDAWGGFTARYLERISDELGKGCRWVFGLKDGKSNARERQILQMANLAQSVHSIDSSASVHIPIMSSPKSLPSYASLNTSSQWQASALQAAAVESITLPTRLRGSENVRTSFDHLEMSLDKDRNRRIVAAGLSIDDPSHLNRSSGHPRDSRMTNGLTHEDEREEENDGVDISLFPTIRNLDNAGGRNQGRRTHKFSKVEFLRGHWTSIEDIQETNADARDRFSGGRQTHVFHSDILFPILSSYPHIFRFTGRPEKLAIKATLATSTGVADQVRVLERNARTLIGVDDREALCDGLAGIADEYEEGWSGSDDSDDND